jgi:hypothetical protein
LSVETESADPVSMLNFYRLLLHARRELAGPFVWVNVDHPDCLAFQRGTSLIVLNAGASTVELPDELVDGRQLWLSSQPDATANRLPSDTCVWLSAAG